MTACNHLFIIAISLVVIGWGTRVYAEGDVTVVSPPPSGNATPVVGSTADGSPVIHKSSHKKKKKSATAVAASATRDGATPTAASTPAVTNPPVTTAPADPPPFTQITNPMTAGRAPVTTVALADPPTSATTALPPPPNSDAVSALVPTVETGLPIARHSSSDDSSYSAPSASYRSTLASSLPPLSSVPNVLPQASSYSTPGADPSANDNYAPDDSEKRTRTYPWKLNIITTEFWIGEPGSSVSATDNIGSAWDENWRSSNGGSDSPTDRQAYLPADHAPRVNPFYVALPFNDLAYPDQARRWLPAGWERRSRDGKQVSACKDRWVEIKNQQGDVCYAQWEDVGPLTSDHPEYVFGDERPDTYTRAGLDVSPAVAKYLGIEPEGRNRLTSWRFVDAEDVPPGYWLKYDEEALIYAAMHDLNNKQPSEMDDDSSIQRAIAPIDDPSQINANKKKVSAAKG